MSHEARNHRKTQDTPFLTQDSEKTNNLQCKTRDSLKDTITIETLSTQGEGIARVEGKAVFVPFALPGETWRVKIVQRKKNYDRARPIKRHGDPHPQRITPICPVFMRCGGCQLQHIDYEEQLRFKRHWLEETFRRIAQLDVTVAPVVPSPPLAYRNKVSLPIVIQGGSLTFAYHEYDAPSRFVPIEDCPIASDPIRLALPRIAKTLNDSGAEPLPPHRDGPIARAMIRTVENRVQLRIVGMRLALERLSTLANALLGPDSPIDVFVWRFEPGRGERSFTRVGATLPEGAIDAFAQVNNQIREELYAYVSELDYNRGDALLDGYCGSGILTRALAKRFQRVVGVEVSEEAVRIAREAALERVEFVCQTMERFLERNRDDFGAVVLNPPRAGLSPEVRADVCRLGASDVVVISCHPAALARDARALIDSGYVLATLQPFDMFPQTHHLETVAHFTWPARTPS